MSGAAASNPRLLVVDESPNALRLIESVLTQAGYDVVCVSEGARALAAVRRFQPQIVFVDTALKDVDVAQLCREIADDDELRAPAVVLMAARSDPRVPRLSSEDSVTDRITKPFTPEALLALAEHLAGRSGEGGHRRGGGAAAEQPAVVSPAAQAAALLGARLATDPKAVAEVTDAVLRVLEDPVMAGQLGRLFTALPGVSALSGDLALVPLPDMLQALALQRQTGILHAQRGASRISVAYKDGAVRLVVGENVGAEFLLGNILVREKAIEPHELALVLQNRQGTSKRLGRQVVQLGYVKPEDLQHALWRQSCELVYELLRWRSGRFEFHRAEDLPPDLLEFDLGMRIEGLLMEGFRRVDEWGLIETVLPSFDVVPNRVASALAHQGKLTPEEQAVFEKIDGRRRVGEIVEAVGGSAFEVARLLYRLISAHLVSVEAGKAGDGGAGPLIT